MNPATIELTAPDISCEKCKATIEGDLAGEPGIGQVTADVGTRQVRITYDREHTSPERLRELETENAKLKRMYADLALENAAIKDVLSRKL